ncbi:MAG: hypothetical protein ACOC24_03785 [Desulfovibrionales bacterium]
MSLLAPALLLSCASLDSPPARFLGKYDLPDPLPAAFSVCTSVGCHSQTGVVLSREEWAAVDALFLPPSRTPEEERRQVAGAVGLMESLVGPKAGTDRDVAKNGWDEFQSPQLDCVAEAANTTVYLTLLQTRGHLRHHRVAYPARRGFLIFFPHNTAVLLEPQTGRAWAVDSWFHDNGHPPEIVLLTEWKAGFRP